MARKRFITSDISIDERLAEVAVEDPQAAATLWVAGIDFIQGNLVQRPDQALDFDFRSATL